MNRNTFLALVIAMAVLSPQVTDANAQDKVERRQPKPEVRYELGADSLKNNDVPQGRLEGPHLFHSDIIENTVRQYWVFVPAQYDKDKPANVLVFQDGARTMNPNGVIRAQNVLENLIAKKQIPVTVGIFITPGQRGDAFPDSIGFGNPNNRDREYDVLDDKYARFIVEEMLPEVGKKYNLSKDRADRAIGGSSSGGICAFTVAWQKPEEFRNVISFIGSFTNIHGGHVYPDLVLEAEKKDIRIFLQDGVNDLRRPDNLERDWHIQNQKMVAAFEEKGYDMAYVFGEGGHSDDHGGAMLPLMLRWVWRDHPDVEDKTDGDKLVAMAKAMKPKVTDPFPGFDASAEVDPSGVYEWSGRMGRTRMASTLKVKNDGGKITGTLETERDGEVTTADIMNPTLEGNKLGFDIEREFNNREMKITYQGIVHGDKIVGWQSFNFRGQDRDRGWEAKKAK
ncbi:alpha/beta hydrolase [Mariniblastus fucicola]|uniref:Endo-1,4-beta-xylanase Z n=1 Tax=Mariniblastus fucicola TaxID=980251 RepID=A0A5B9PI74_9BACT|nr:alpha/beta hydrolase-fold protein [Mariniblastus fucicola]QEG25000.1 Endo-1,4-beta-xylanase Z precursor [Mariniblastus fucicola]